MRRKKHFRLSTTHIILLSFIAVIFLGGFLLWLPISHANGVSISFTDALFTATTATCVTGLVTVPTATAWSYFGQAVILVLIQVGGLGVITVMSGIMLLMNKRMGLGGRLLLQDAFNLNTLSGMVKFVRHVILGTFTVEGIGAVLYMTVFIPQFGWKGIWISVFNSVSAFCNAGMDVIGENSLCDYISNPLVNAVTCALIIMGGIGYVVWLDVARVVRNGKGKRRRLFHDLTLHSKLAISVSAFLIFAGAALILFFEYDNPLTMKELSLFDKIQLAFFQSVTTRTAGYITVPQQYLTTASTALCLLLMFIGGSPVGTAGGIKTVTVAVLMISALESVQGRNEVSVFGRRISKSAVTKSVAVCMTSVTIVVLSTLLLSATTDADLADVLYETVSATATVGLSRNLTPGLNELGKLILIVTMYLGRVGPISFALALNSNRKKENIIKEPTEDISVG